MTQQGVFELAAVLALQGDFTVVDNDAVHGYILRSKKDLLTLCRTLCFSFK
jgi:hypothetical protein